MKEPDDYIVIEDTTKQLGIKVNTVIPRSKMYLRVSFIQKVTWILVAVLIAIIISASVLFSKQMVYLIRKLQSSMKRLENGNYELIEETVGNDELGSLVKAIIIWSVRWKHCLRRYIRQVYARKCTVSGTSYPD